MNDRPPDEGARPTGVGRAGDPATGLGNIVDPTAVLERCQTCADFNYASLLVEAAAFDDRPVHGTVAEKWQAGPGTDWEAWASSRPLGDPRRTR